MFDAEQFRRQMIDQGSADIQRIISEMGFGDFVPNRLIRLLTDAWFEGAKWGANMVVYGLQESRDEAIAAGATINGYKKAD